MSRADEPPHCGIECVAGKRVCGDDEPRIGYTPVQTLEAFGTSVDAARALTSIG